VGHVAFNLSSEFVVRKTQRCIPRDVRNKLVSYGQKTINKVTHKTINVRPSDTEQNQTLREEHRLRVFENRVLRRIFGTKRMEVAGGWRRLSNEELRILYISPNIIRVIKSRRMR